MQVVETASQPASEPRRRRWTKSEFYRMADLGWFTGQRAELVDGEIVVLSPRKFLHASTTDRVAEQLKNLLGFGYWVRTQLPLDTGEASLPEPDISVVRGRREDYSDHPNQAALVVEVSDTTLGFDRGAKANDYAAAGVPEYWIVNLVDNRLEVFRKPVADSAVRGGWRYEESLRLDRSASVEPLAAAGRRLSVAEILPPGC